MIRRQRIEISKEVTHASVTVDGELLGRIGKGFMILLGWLTRIHRAGG